MRPDHGPGWNEELAEHLTKLWASGLSATQIGIRMGKTRNAIIGKVHRLGLPPRAVVQRAPRTRNKASGLPLRPTRVGYGARNTVALAPRSAPALTVVPRIVQELNIPAALRVDLLDLREGMCRFPIGDPRDEAFHFCGCPQADGTSYCGHHDRITRQPAKPRQSSFFRLEALYG